MKILDIVERRMTKKEKSKEERLKTKYDDSGMKASMKKQYGDDWEEVYYATIRKQSMDENASAKEEDKFHRKLDKLVHKTFGHSSDEVEEAYTQSAAPSAQLKGKEKAPIAKIGRTDHPHGGRLVGETEMKRKEITEINVGGILDGLRAIKNKIMQGFKPKVNKKLRQYEKSIKALIFLSKVSDRRLKNALQGTGIRPSEIRNLIDNDLPILLNADSAEVSTDALLAAIERVEPLYEKIMKAKSKVQDEEFFAYLAAASIGGIMGFLATSAADERKKRNAKDTELNETIGSSSIASAIGTVGKPIKRSKAYNADGTMINALDVKENDKQYVNSIRRR